MTTLSANERPTLPAPAMSYPSLPARGDFCPDVAWSRIMQLTALAELRAGVFPTGDVHELLGHLAGELRALDTHVLEGGRGPMTMIFPVTELEEDALVPVDEVGDEEFALVFGSRRCG